MSGPARAGDGFRLVFEIAVHHAYYAGAGDAAQLRWSWDAVSQQLMRRAGCVMRATADGVAVYVECARLAVLQALASDAGGPLDLLLLAHSLDADFAAVTAGPGRARVLHLFDSTRARAPRADGWYRLYRAARPSHSETGQDAWAVLNRQRWPARQGMPALALRMRIEPGAAGGDAWASRALGRRWRLALHARATHWKYLLPAEWAAQRPRVVDLCGEVLFDAPVTEFLADGRAVLAVCSRSPIALRRHPPQQFQLQAQAPCADPLLVRRLPAAAPGALSRELVDGVPRLQSHIHVNR